jgi:hypothetical protein
VVWLSDGGRGFWRLCEERFARHATGILDFTMRPNTCGRLRQLGWMDAPAKPGDGLPGRGTVSDMGCRTASSPTWRTPGTWRDCARDRPRHFDDRACLSDTASRAYQLCSL